MSKNKKILLSLILVIVFIGLGFGGYYAYNRWKSFDFSLDSEKKAVERVYPSFYQPDLFMNDKGELEATSFPIYFDKSVAPLSEVGKIIDKDISISPKVKGVFKWESENRISFYPEEKYKIGTDYKIELKDELIDKGYSLDKNEFTFKTNDFIKKSYEASLVEDAKNPKIKKATFNLYFNYPINREVFSKNLKVTLDGKNYKHEIFYDNFDMTVSVVTDAITIEDKKKYAEITANGVISIFDNSKKIDIANKVFIPSSDDYFKVDNTDSRIIRNNEKNDRPERIVFVNLSSAMNGEDLAKNIEIYQINPIKGANQKYSYDKIDFSMIPSAEKYQNNFMFKYEAKGEGNQALLKIKSGLYSKDGFKMTKDYSTTFYIPDYEKELKIGFSGALITSKGEGYISMMSRGISSINVKISRIANSSINNLISQSNGNIKNFSFESYLFNENNIAENFEEIVPILGADKAKESYSSINLAKYIKDEKGIFIINAMDKDGYVSDKRLIMFTDLGLMVKKSATGILDVFVSSIKEGKPVKKAKVEVIGLNGVPILSEFSDSDGHVKFPKLDDFKDEKYPTAIVVTKDNDVTFIPYDNYNNRLNYSKFEVGGNYTGYDVNKVTGLIFSDRGIYRPSEKVNLGLILRRSDFSIPSEVPFEIYVTNPIGKEVYKKELKISDDGFSEFGIETYDTSMTGIYNVSLYTLRRDSYGRYYREEHIANETFKIEEFTPDRMKMAINLVGDMKKGWENSKSLAFNINLKNLFSSPATSRKVKSKMELSPKGFSFKEYKDFYFKPVENMDREISTKITKDLEELVTDDNGNAVVNVDLSDYENGTYNLVLSAEGFELDGGRGVSSIYSALVSPEKFIVGFKADGDLNYISKNTKRSIEFIAIDNNLEKIEVSDLKIAVNSIKYISSLVKQNNGIYSYQSVRKETEIDAKAYVLNRDKENLVTIDTKEAGDFILMIRDNRTDKILARIPYTVAGAGNLSYKLDKNAELKLGLDKPEYNAGDEIEVNIKAPYQGYGLISIENKGLATYKWFSAKENSTIEKIKIPDDLEGNAYLNVSFVRGYDSKEIFTSPLSYAVVPFSINKEKRKIDIDLKVVDKDGKEQEKYTPSETIKIKYKASKPCKIILYGVDEGILNVAKYKLPRPLAKLYEKQALEVATFQVLDLIMPEFKYLKELSSIGGDEMDTEGAISRNLNPFARKVAKPVVFWSGLIDADENEKEYEYTLPDTFNGAMKIMAVASSKYEGKVGSNQLAIKVRGDFVVLPNAPFVVAPNDEFEISAGITNLIEDTDKSEFIIKLGVSDNLEIIGENEKQLSIGKNLEDLAKFRVQALKALGNAEMNFTVINAKNSKQIRASITSSIRPTAVMKTDLKAGFSKGSLDLEGFSKPMYAEFKKREIAVSYSPLVFSSGLLNYLKSYPHGCTEQIISKVFPDIVLSNNNDSEVSEVLKHTFQKIRARQLSSGAFSTWDNSDYVSEFNSLYAINFMIYAKNKGYNVPNDMFNAAINWAREYVNKSGIDSLWQAKLKAYAIYLLTMNEEITTSYILNLEQELDNGYKDKWQKNIISAFIASSYRLLKEDKKALDLIKKYDLFKNNKESYFYYSDFDTNNINDAMYVYLVNRHFPEMDLKSNENIENLSRPIINGDYNTLLAAYNILALSSYGKDDKDIVLKAFSASKKERDLPIIPSRFKLYDLGNDDIKSLKSDDKELFYAITNQGFFETAKIENTAKGVEIFKDFYVDGKKVVKANVGDTIDVVIRLKATNGRENYNMAMIDLFVGGFEYVRDSLKIENEDYHEAREDRLVVYLKVDDNITEIKYKLKATTKGRFEIPEIVLNSLYNQYIGAVYRGDLVFVVE